MLGQKAVTASIVDGECQWGRGALVRLVWRLPAAPLLSSVGIAAAPATMVLRLALRATFVATMGVSLTRYAAARQALLGFAFLVVGGVRGADRARD